MAEVHVEPQRVRPRQSLSARLWLVATLAVLLTEVVVFLPLIAHERWSWLGERLDDGAVASSAAIGSTIGPGKAAEMLKLAGTRAIRMTAPDGTTVAIGETTAVPMAVTDLRAENQISGLRRALGALIMRENRLVSVRAANPYDAGYTEEIVIDEQALGRALRRYAGDFAILALLIAGVTGGLVYLAVLLLLVRPMRRLTGSIAAFRSDPERTTPLDPDEISMLSDDEISVAGRELAAMQHELRGALWRNARLAALGTVCAKVSHDLRGILTPALLTAERLQLNADPKVQRAGETLAQAVDRATDLVRRTLDYAREGPPPLAMAPVELAPLVDEAADTARPLTGALRLANTIDQTIAVTADRTQLFRVLANLLRNAVEAGARSIQVSAQHNSPTLSVDICDDGPGLPEAVQADLFRPFAGSRRRGGTGLGLAIARDLMVAHGGTIELVETGEGGTTFRLTLRIAGQAAAEQKGARIAPPAAADV
jgi:signal transduction histidine kinase